MKSIEGSVPESRLELLEYRLKGEESPKRKFAGGGSDDPIKVVSDMNDTVRYTFVAEDGAYSATADKILWGLKKQGFTPVKVKNTWGGDMSQYHGLNTTWQSKSGQLFEVQVHTPSSLSAKTVEHPIYQLRRVKKATLEQIEHARSVFRSVPIPSGASTVHLEIAHIRQAIAQVVRSIPPRLAHSGSDDVRGVGLMP
jgi:hypothetical protein